MNAPIPELRPDHGRTSGESFQVSLLDESLHRDAPHLLDPGLLQALWGATPLTATSATWIVQTYVQQTRAAA